MARNYLKSFRTPLVKCMSFIQIWSLWNVVTQRIRSARAPNADLPNTAAFLGGLVAQEVIKVITKQYVPIEGYCCVDLVETWTGTLSV